MKPLQILIKHDSFTPLNQQLFEQLRALILARSLEPGDPLPPSRQLAKDLDISRKTVVSAYDQLISEGYLESRVGSGTFVSLELREPDLSISRSTDDNIDDSSVPLSQYGRYARSITLLSSQKEQIFSFHSWQPAFDELPFADWNKVIARAFRSKEADHLDFSKSPGGYLPLRQAIAAKLQKTRGMKCTPAQVIITCGHSQALDMVARIHIEEGLEALFENPSWTPARDIFRAYGATIRSISVDKDGIRTSNLSRLVQHNITVVYVTPSHQFPTGAVLTLPRRLELLHWAAEQRCMIVEDDFDSEFRYRGKPIPALKTLDTGERVIYMSTFNKTLYPSLGVGYLVVPESLVEVYTRARWLSAEQISTQLQAAIADFMDSGQLDKHIRRMKSIYARRRQVLVDSLKTYLGEDATVAGDIAGLSLLVTIDDIDDEELVEEAAAEGLMLTSTKSFYTRSSRAGEFLLGYGNMPESQIDVGIKRLRSVIRRVKK